MLAIVGAGCASVGPIEDAAPGERPRLDSDEAGLWMQMDAVETRLKSSGRVVTDPELNAYVRTTICRLSQEYCEDIRFYIVRTPHFNATMAPNGYMEVWTGLLLRADNEAQLAYVLGHEIGHYQRRHTLQRFRDARDKTALAGFFQIAAAAAGVGYAGSLGQLLAYASMLSFSRDQEREADDVGFTMMVGAGYDPSEAPRIWEALIAERDASDAPEPSVFFSTHPATADRVDYLRSRAESSPAGDERYRGRERHQAAIAPYRAEWLRDEFRKRKFAETEVVVERLRASGERIDELWFVTGEFYRFRDGDGDSERAIEAYHSAIRTGTAPVQTHRSLGLVYWHAGRRADALSAVRDYLAAAPDAPDAEMIGVYIDELEKEQ
ncbi:MAG: M48 family metallopeptidase [Gammaproteobacteria bacterium]|nr:M48 family metallopeptidase [Gammaproteobacteria bacterium]